MNPQGSAARTLRESPTRSVGTGRNLRPLVGVGGCQYNKYENSLEPSYLVIDPSVITIQQIQSITPEYIDTELGRFFNDFHI